MRAPVYAPRITFGNILTLLGGMAGVAVFLITIGIWMGRVDNDAMNIKGMIASLHSDTYKLSDKLDRVAEAVASLDGKIASIKRINGIVPPQGVILTPIADPK